MHIIILLPLHNVERTTSRHSKSKNIYISREKSVRKKKKKKFPSKIAVQQFHLNLFPTIHAIRQLRKRATTILRANN